MFWMLRFRALLILFLVSALLNAEVALGQRGSRLEDLFRSILESQIGNVTDDDRPASDRVTTRGPGAVSPDLPSSDGQIVSNRRTINRVPAAVRTPEGLRDFQRRIDAFVEQASFLSSTLHQQAAHNGSLRAVLPEVMHVKAIADMIQTMSRRAYSIDDVYYDYLDLDWRWRKRIV